MCAYIFNYYLSFHSFRECLGSRKGKNLGSRKAKELVPPEVIFTLLCLRHTHTKKSLSRLDRRFINVPLMQSLPQVLT